MLTHKEVCSLIQCGCGFGLTVVAAHSGHEGFILLSGPIRINGGGE